MASNSKSSDKIRLTNVRASFLKLDKPEAFEEGQTKKYQASALLDPSDAEHAKLIKLLKAKAAELCEDAYGEVPEEIKDEPLDRLPFGLANKHPKKKKYDGYEDMFYVSTSNTIRPAIANRAGEAVESSEPQFPYSGCYVNMNISLWALLGPNRAKYGPRIGANLIGIQFVKDGEAFGQAPPRADEEFEALEDNSPADADDDWDEDDSPF